MDQSTDGPTYTHTKVFTSSYCASTATGCLGTSTLQLLLQLLRHVFSLDFDSVRHGLLTLEPKESVYRTLQLRLQPFVGHKVDCYFTVSLVSSQQSVFAGL